jgi:hypothetical protein
MVGIGPSELVFVMTRLVSVPRHFVEALSFLISLALITRQITSAADLRQPKRRTSEAIIQGVTSVPGMQGGCVKPTPEVLYIILSEFGVLFRPTRSRTR